MRELQFELKELTRRHGEGSQWTQAGRHRSLQAIGRELHDEGFKLRSARNLKPRHITALLDRWKRDEINHATIRNRLGTLRWLAAKVGKPGLLPASNEGFELEERSPFKGLRARPLDRDRLAGIDDPRIRMALRLQQAFGLRREEALKFRPSVADKGTYLALKPSWTKGGRYREIPLTDPRQRVLLEEVHDLCGSGAIIPDGQTFHQFRKAYDNATLRAGLRNNHGLRHWYACWRYRKLSGALPPALGGRTCDGMTPAERRQDYFVRLQVSRELGHNRVDVTTTYLGRRWAPKAATA